MHWLLSHMVAWLRPDSPAALEHMLSRAIATANRQVGGASWETTDFHQILSDTEKSFRVYADRLPPWTKADRRIIRLSYSLWACAYCAGCLRFLSQEEAAQAQLNKITQAVDRARTMLEAGYKSNALTILKEAHP